MGDIMLEIKELTKQYGTFTALDHLSVTFDTGVYGLLGPNGAGKSTFLNLITDNLQRSSGSILYNGKDISKLGGAYRRKIGYTPQVKGMYEDFTARDFLHYIGALKGMKSSECKRQTEEFLEIVNLHKDAHRRIGSFSGGMKQRTLLAAAMLDEPEILILDEPTVGLDPEERFRLRSYIASIAKERTVLLATHIVGDIESIAGKVLLLTKGRLCRFDSPAALVEELEALVAKGGEAEQLVQEACGRTSGLGLEEVYLYYAARQRQKTE